MAAFSFNFLIEGSTADCEDGERSSEFEFVSNQPTNVGSTVAIGACTRGRDESEGLKSASVSDHNGELEHKCGLVSISEDSVSGLCRPGGAQENVGVPVASYNREVVQLNDKIEIVCLTDVRALSSENFAEEGMLGGEAPSSELQLSVVQQAQKASSDLIAGVYEGGMKIWECAVDLASFLLSNNALCCGKQVMELGCGVGLPGVCALLQGAQMVAFQDYNVEVLTSRTIPTAFHNGALKGRQFRDVEEFSSACQFCYGDWGMLVQKMSKNGHQWKHEFDVVLASETIYCRESYPNFLSALHEVFP